MEVFKLAFETTIVGLLTLDWQGLGNPYSFSRDPDRLVWMD